MDCATEAVALVVISSTHISTVIKSRKIRRPERTELTKEMNYRNFKEIGSFWTSKWKDMGLKEMKCDGADCIQLTEQRPVAGSCEHDEVHSGSIHSEEYRDK